MRFFPRKPRRGQSVWWVTLPTFLILLAWVQAGLADQEQLRERVGGVRVPFIANRGQTNPAVAYYAPTFAGTVYVTKKGEIVYSLPASPKDTRGSALGVAKAFGAGWTLTEIPVRGRARVAAERPAEAQVNYFIGNDPARWRSGIPTYEGVSFGEVWPGVFLSLRAHGDNVEKLFTVRPGAEPSCIRMRVAGAKSLRVNEAGALVATTGLGEVTFTPPVAYQEQDGLRRSVTVAYRARGREYGFSLGRHDPALPVVIDPFLQATYLGGSGEDWGYALAIHPTSGEAYVTGLTGSADFPGTTGGAQPAFTDVSDVFVARMNAALTTLLQATYLGGHGTTSGCPARPNLTCDRPAGGSLEIGRALAIHPTSGEVFVAGLTFSADFPGTTGGAQPASGGEADAFVARLNASLTTLSQATYLGGSGGDDGFALAIHPTSGEVIVAGATYSPSFPGTTGGAQPASGGAADAFVARLNATLTTLSQATYLGGSGEDWGYALAIHPTSGELFVAGQTNSGDFPGTTGGAQPAFGGVNDAFVARLNATLTTLSQATYLGGTGDDFGRALASHPTSGDVFVAGPTFSADFPGTAGGAQPASGGATDAFVARLNATLTTLSQATYLGGSGGDDGFALAIHPTSGEVFVAGATYSPNFPVTAGGAQSASGGAADAFVARLNATLTTLSQATYLGGSGEDWGYALAIHPTSGDVFVAGGTPSANFPGTAGGAQPASGGGADAFVAHLTADLKAILVPAALVMDPTSTAVSDGNGVFEPGETAAVQSAWQNGDDSGHALTGAASEFTGPAGATYALMDDSAVYGALAPAETRSCAATPNCYSMSVSSPATRPLLHWDATFVETPSTTDLAKTWTLHLGDSFTDVPRSYPFYKKIETIFHNGITVGCAGSQYCPGDKVERSQMAIFIARVIARGTPLPTSGVANGSLYDCVEFGTSVFTDVSPTDIACKGVHYIASQNVTGGCDPSLYCPALEVTRAEMAIFVARAIVAPGGGTAVPQTYGPDPVTGFSYSCNPASPNLHFTDVAVSDNFCKHTHFLWAKGVIAGCSSNEYCPIEQVGRDEMAKFLANAFRLELYGP